MICRQSRSTIGPMPVHQGREAGLGGLLWTCQERLQELPVGQVPDHDHAA